MNDIELTYRQFYIYVIIGGAILGAIFGIIPLLLGRKRNKARLGVYGFIASIVGGAIAVTLAGWLGTRSTVNEPPLTVLRQLG